MVKPREKRVPIMMSEDEMAVIDDWRFENRVATRSDAIRRLCRIGLLWDDVAGLLHQELVSTISDAERGTEEFVGVLGNPTDEAPAWVSKFVLASLRANMKILEHLSEIGDIVRMAASPADAMKLEGKFEDANLVSLRLQSEILAEAAKRYGADIGESSDGAGEKD